VEKPLVLNKEAFGNLLDVLKAPTNLNRDFLFSCYLDAIEGAAGLKEENALIASLPLNNVQLVLYIVNEHSFYLMMHKEGKAEEFEKKDEYRQLIVSIALDKYFTNEHLAYQSGSFASRFLPEISTISLYLNFILGMLNRYKRGDPKETLVVDVLQKGFSMAKCITGLLTDGFETEAFSTWRTLHENECILSVLVKYGKPVIDRYLRHLTYAVAFRSGLKTKEETDAIFVEIKSLMQGAGLKSKDMKRFIEYGWLLGIPDVLNMEDFKFNFRDGVERCAGLREYSKVYEMSSEIAHSSALLIYSRKNYFFLVTMLNLYESFFRLEKIFSSLYMSTAPVPDQERYMAMRNLYFGELMTVYSLEKKRLSDMTGSEHPKLEEEDKESPEE